MPQSMLCYPDSFTGFFGGSVGGGDFFPTNSGVKSDCKEEDLLRPTWFLFNNASFLAYHFCTKEKYCLLM